MYNSREHQRSEHGQTNVSHPHRHRLPTINQNTPSSSPAISTIQRRHGLSERPSPHQPPQSHRSHTASAGRRRALGRLHGPPQAPHLPRSTPRGGLPLRRRALRPAGGGAQSKVGTWPAADPSFTTNVAAQPFPRPSLSTQMRPSMRPTNLRHSSRVSRCFVIDLMHVLFIVFQFVCTLQMRRSRSFKPIKVIPYWK